MPVISVDGPKLADIDKKRKFVETITDAASSLYELPRQSIVVLLKENTPDNVGVGGQLVSDRDTK